MENFLESQMPTQEAIIALMDQFIQESAKEGMYKKIKITQSLIPLLYSYLKEWGLSDDEINEFYNEFKS